MPSGTQPSCSASQTCRSSTARHRYLRVVDPTWQTSTSPSRHIWYAELPGGVVSSHLSSSEQVTLTLVGSELHGTLERPNSAPRRKHPGAQRGRRAGVAERGATAHRRHDVRSIATLREP